MKTKPMKHQAEYFEEFADAAASAIFLPQGTGKSKTAIDTAFNLFEKGEINAFIYVTMKVTVGRFHKELAKHAWSKNYKLGIMTGGMKTAQKKEFEAMKKFKGLKVLALNHRQLGMVQSAAEIRKFLKENNCLMVIDESHKIKTPSAKQARSAVNLSMLAKYRRVMTGTSLTKNLLDLYNQFAFLDKEIIGFRNFTAFKNRYAVTIKKKAALGHWYDEIVGFRNEEELIEKIKPFTFYRRKSECLDLPPKVYEVVEDELTPDQRRIYKELKNERVAYSQDPPRNVSTPEQMLIWAVENNVLINGVNPLTRMIRFQQILSGYVNDTPIKCNRYKTLVEVLESIGDNQVVIWANFRYEVEEIKRTLGDAGVIHYGGMKDRDKNESIDRFASGDAQYFIANPSSAGTGLDELSVAHYEIYFSNGNNFADRTQSEDRCHRHGTVHSVSIIDIVAPETIDEIILKRIEDKRDTFDSFYEALR